MLSELNLGSISHNQKRYFQWQRLVTQLLFAALSTWLISALLRVYRASGGFSEIVRGEKRVFVIDLAGAAGCYLVWLLIFWPGVMSVDSLKIWRAAQLPEVYLNDHPILNVFLYSYLYHIWNNQAVVPLFHVLVTSLQVAYHFLWNTQEARSTDCASAMLSFHHPVHPHRALQYRPVERYPLCAADRFLGIRLCRIIPAKTKQCPHPFC